MAMVGASTLNPTEIARHLQSLQAERKSYEASHKEWLKGRDIRNAELEAQKAIADAKRKAEEIIATASGSVKEIERDRESVKALKAKVEGALESANRAKLEAEKAKQSYEAELNVLKAKQALADEQMKKHAKCESEAKERLAKIAAFVEEMNGHSH